MFKSELTLAFFDADNHLCLTLRKQKFTLASSKSHVLRFLICEFRSVLCLSVFQGSIAYD